MTRTLVIGYDGSENAADAVALGAVLAECLAATPLVVTVVPSDAAPVGPEGSDAKDQLAKPVLDQARTQLRGFDVQTRALADDSPAHALHKLAESLSPVAVVLGSARHGGIGRILLGSVGRALLSGAPSPIAVAPRDYAQREKRSVRTIGAALSGSAESRPALAAAIGLAGRLHASLTVLTVVEPVLVSHGGEYPALDPAAYERASRERAEAMLDDAFSRLPSGLEAERRVLTGEPAETIAEAGTELDLLVVGSRAYGPVRRALLGSVSARLVDRAPCPVLVLPRGAGDDPLELSAA